MEWECAYTTQQWLTATAPSSHAPREEVQLWTGTRSRTGSVGRTSAMQLGQSRPCCGKRGVWSYSAGTSYIAFALNTTSVCLHSTLKDQVRMCVSARAHNTSTQGEPTIITFPCSSATACLTAVELPGGLGRLNSDYLARICVVQHAGEATKGFRLRFNRE